MRWDKLPLVMRAILAGLSVAIIPNIVWGAILQINLRHGTGFPWAALLMAVFLVLCWKYLQGWGWPQTLAQARRIGLRAPALPSDVWRRSLLAGGSGLAASILLYIVAHRLVPWRVAAVPDFNKSPQSPSL